MMTIKRLLISLLCAVILTGVFSWPLIRHFSDGIPYTSVSAEQPAARHMVMGDHLQLLYHFWLTADWLGGGTPWGYNPYIFNEGDDEATACPSTDYMPFSLAFGFFHLLFSRAASWNLTILLVFWLSHFFLTRLLRLYGATEPQAVCVALMAIGVPYQWAAIFGGSPTGFAMMAVPILLYGLERVIRDGSLGGGVIAALGLLAAFWTDAHVLLFSLFLAPAWGVMVLIHEERFPWRTPVEWGRRIIAAVPLAVMALSSVVLRMKSKSGLGDTIVGGGRDWREVALFSPRGTGLFTWHAPGHDHTIYLGILLLSLLAAGIAYGVARSVAGRKWRRLLHVVLLALAFGVIVAFALGVHGPRDAMALRMARKLIPPISMIRQPAKIFSILFPIVAVLVLPLFRWMAGGVSAPAWKKALPMVIALAVLLDLKMQMRPGISLLNEKQGAYAAVVRDAADGETPRVMVLPIWPGDSAWASIYQYNASLYRLRMINGYLPVVSRAYVETVYLTLDSANTGVFEDRQIQFLKERGIHYVILHEDAYPEQVSWFPVGLALKKLLLHPRLELIEQDGSVWAFRILDEPESDVSKRPAYPVVAQWRLFGSRIQSEMEHEQRIGQAMVLADPSASDGHFVRLASSGDAASMGNFNHQEAPDTHLMVRLRGNAAWRFDLHNDEAQEVTKIDTAEEAWIWRGFPVPWRRGTETVRPSFHLEEGQLDLDRVAFVSGEPPQPAPGEAFFIPAPVLFHAGYTDLERNAVKLRASHEPAGRILYGPRWPVPEGTYQAELVWDEPPPHGIMAGALEVRLGFHHVAGTVPITGHNDTPLEFSTGPFNAPLEFGFYYTRAADLGIRGIRVTRME